MSPNDAIDRSDETVKLMLMYRRRPGVAPEQNRQALLADELIAWDVPGLRRHVRSVTTLSGYRGRDPIYDAVDEFWFDDEAASQKAMAADPLRSAADRLSADPASLVSVLMRDHQIKNGPIAPNGLKNFEFVTRRPDLSVSEFRDYWRGHHGPLATGIPTMLHYVQSHAVDSEYSENRSPMWEGSAITWFADMSAMRASADCEVYEPMRRDEANFLGSPGELPFIITTEHVLRPAGVADSGS
jgi:uncharacterized protein (TIGR02118 family)